MAPRKKNHGVGAVVNVLVKFLHPSQLIRNKFPNPENGQRLEGCITLRQEVKKINRKDQLALVVTHEDFVDGNGNLQELHAVKKHFSIEKEGEDKDLFFDARATVDQEERQDQPLPAVIDDYLAGTNDGGVTELIEALTGVVDIDDDNLPLPENIPANEPTGPTPVMSSDWGHSGFCFRRQNNLPNSMPKLCNPVDTSRNDVNLQLFERLFPRRFMEETMIPATNKKLDHPLTYGELLRWIGLWVLISTVDGSDRRGFWSSKKPNIYEGAPFRLTEFMSRTRFEKILSAICYTDREPPVQLDRFWEVRQLLEEWNKNMDENFIPGWINTIDESMSNS